MRVGETEQAAPLLPPPELRDLLDSLIKTFQHNTASYKEKNSSTVDLVATCYKFTLIWTSGKNLKVKQSYIIKTTISTTY